MDKFERDRDDDGIQPNTFNRNRLNASNTPQDRRWESQSQRPGSQTDRNRGDIDREKDRLQERSIDLERGLKRNDTSAQKQLPHQLKRSSTFTQGSRDNLMNPKQDVKYMGMTKEQLDLEFDNREKEISKREKELFTWEELLDSREKVIQDKGGSGSGFNNEEIERRVREISDQKDREIQVANQKVDSEQKEKKRIEE
ncbi:MAG: hypothetical protein EZS28_054842, partial [Streblomastix strix]